MNNKTYLISLFTLTLWVSKTVIAHEVSSCEVKKFYNVKSEVTHKKLESDYQTTFSVSENDAYIIAVEYAFNGSGKGYLLDNLTGIRDNQTLNRVWNNNFRYKVIENYLLHKTKLLKEISMPSGDNINVIDAYFDNSVSRYAFSTSMVNGKSLLYHVQATSKKKSNLPDATKMSFILKSMKNSCQN